MASLGYLKNWIGIRRKLPLMYSRLYKIFLSQRGLHFNFYLFFTYKIEIYLHITLLYIRGKKIPNEPTSQWMKISLTLLNDIEIYSHFNLSFIHWIQWYNLLIWLIFNISLYFSNTRRLINYIIIFYCLQSIYWFLFILVHM